jgi:4-alpha-glucanotransferase
MLVDQETSLSRLNALAAAFGIEPSFTDARGDVQTTSDVAKRALLAAFGAPANDEAAAQRALDQLHREDWLRPLPPAVVTTAQSDITIAIVLPADTGDVRWRIVLEDASERLGNVPFASLRRLEASSIDAHPMERRELVLTASLPHGYHQLRIEGADAEMALIVAPARCVLPDALVEKKAWGLAVQLYLLRSRRNWGIGDYSDLRGLVELTAAHGADVVGLNPLHALFLDEPEHVSPYSPASRLLLNVLNIDVTAIPEFAACKEAQALFASAGFQVELEASRAANFVRYAAVADSKLPVLRLVFASVDESSVRYAAFEQFMRLGGVPLQRATLFQALRSHFSSGDPDRSDWRAWPPEYRDSDSDDVARFGRENRDELRFLAWLQWICDEQLAAAAAAARATHMRIGLYRDLAVGADPNGAEIWANAEAVVQTASIGAPPDIYNPPGQNWGLPPFHPRALRAEGYRSFIDLVRANMRHAGAIRIDHVMALQHLYLIPHGHEPGDGAYVGYPLDDLVGILALESSRHNCLVIGEDLGTVPAGFRERMDAANILSYRVLFFETDPVDGSFVAPERYPERAVAVVGSHDLPTLRAWMDGTDIDLRARLGLLREAEATDQREARGRARAALLAALRKCHLLTLSDETNYGAVLVSVHAFLARSNAVLAIAQIDDVSGESDPVNVPTTNEQYPNWRRRISATVEELAVDGRLDSIAATFAKAGRGHD